MRLAARLAWTRWPCALALTALLGGSEVRADTLTPFTALLNGGQETPPVGTPAQGVAFLTYNSQQKTLCYSISYSPLGSTEVVAHVHGPGAPGQSAPVLFGITPTPSPVGSPKTGCVGPLSKDDYKNLRRGLLYLNIHSATFPNGEIRGQIVLAPGTRYKNVPAIPSSPSGAFLDDAPDR